MQATCKKCGTTNAIPSGTEGPYRCNNCGAFLPKPTEDAGDNSAAVGMIGGAALGAALGGPPGALIGAVLGAILGKEAKGVG